MELRTYRSSQTSSDWEKAQPHASYLVSLQRLKGTIPNQAVLDAVSFDGGAEAVVSDYGTQKLVIVEFNTALLATDNDQRIKARLEELRNQDFQRQQLIVVSATMRCLFLTHPVSKRRIN